MPGLKFMDLEQNRRLFCDPDDKGSLRSVLEDAGRFWVSQGVIKRVPDVNASISRAVCDIKEN